MTADLRRTVIDFLNSAGTSLATVTCPDCGSGVEYRKTTFFYEGLTWDIPFPMCPKCNPVTHLPTHRA
jgi:ribosomal protein S27AE